MLIVELDGEFLDLGYSCKRLHQSARESPAFMPGRDSAARKACRVIAVRIQH